MNDALSKAPGKKYSFTPNKKVNPGTKPIEPPANSPDILDDNAELADGEWYGTATDGQNYYLSDLKRAPKIGPSVVKVKIVKGKIVKVTSVLYADDKGFYENRKNNLLKILAGKTLSDVNKISKEIHNKKGNGYDAVSGATYTGRGHIKALGFKSNPEDNTKLNKVGEIPVTIYKEVNGNKLEKTFKVNVTENNVSTPSKDQIPTKLEIYKGNEKLVSKAVDGKASNQEKTAPDTAAKNNVTEEKTISNKENSPLNVTKTTDKPSPEENAETLHIKKTTNNEENSNTIAGKEVTNYQNSETKSLD